jgi:hypothetical protein
MSAVGLAASFLLPPVDFSQGVAASAGGQMLAAEMTNLEPSSEPAPLLPDRADGTPRAVP